MRRIGILDHKKFREVLDKLKKVFLINLKREKH